MLDSKLENKYQIEMEAKKKKMGFFFLFVRGVLQWRQNAIGALAMLIMVMTVALSRTFLCSFSLEDSSNCVLWWRRLMMCWSNFDAFFFCGILRFALAFIAYSIFTASIYNCYGIDNGFIAHNFNATELHTFCRKLDFCLQTSFEYFDVWI